MVKVPFISFQHTFVKSLDKAIYVLSSLSGHYFHGNTFPWQPHRGFLWQSFNSGIKHTVGGLKDTLGDVYGLQFMFGMSQHFYKGRFTSGRLITPRPVIWTQILLLVPEITYETAEV